MRQTRLALLLSLSLSASQALAADLGAARETPVYAPAAAEPVIVENTSRRFYVRGDVGLARYGFSQFSQADLADNGGRFVSQSIGDATVTGAGFGWQLGHRFRADLTGEYRGTAQVKGLDHLTGTLTGPDGTLLANTHYQGNLSAVVGLANGYWDIASWRGFTPYVGAGIGVTANRMTGLTTTSSAAFTDATTGEVTTQVSAGLSRDKTQINFAWALMAGTSYDLSHSAKLDLGYRYLNLGGGASATSSLLNCECGTVGQPLKVHGIDAQELRLGIRWLLAEPAQPVAYQASQSYQPLK